MGEGEKRWRELLWAVVHAEERLLAVQRTLSPVQQSDTPKREQLAAARLDLGVAESQLELWLATEPDYLWR